MELGKGWHADHVKPYSKGGPTRAWNGAALCPSCNLKKGDTMVTDPRSVWQREALDRYMQTQGDFLVTAAPGAGKTRCALSMAQATMQSGKVRRLVVVVPGAHLRRQWSNEAAKYGIDLTATYSNGDGPLTAAEHGAVVTYQAVAANPHLWAKHSRGALVVLDEVHHAGDEAAWGAAIRTAFEGAARRLLLSGTPFRSDRAAIPFVTYDDNGVSRADYPYDYGIAVTRGVVRPVRFEVMDGQAVWRDVGTLSEVALSQASDDEVRHALRTVYDPSGQWVPSVLARADAELTRAREEVPDAGGLILAPGIREAEAYRVAMQSICGERVEIVHGNMPDPGSVISGFRAGRQRWLVAVQMVAEGVDIPRLLVGVYCSPVLTEMWFRQVVGRLVRRRDADDESTATMFVPQVSPIVQMAKRIDREVEAGLREAERETRDAVERSGGTLALSYIEPVGSSEAVRTGVIVQGGDSVTDAELRAAELLARGIPGLLARAHVGDLALFMRAVNGGQQRIVAAAELPAPTITTDQRRAALRRQVNRLAARYAANSGEQHAHVHSNLNRMHGDSLPTASVATLEKRIEVLTRWLSETS